MHFSPNDKSHGSNIRKQLQNIVNFKSAVLTILSRNILFYKLGKLFKRIMQLSMK